MIEEINKVYAEAKALKDKARVDYETTDFYIKAAQKYKNAIDLFAKYLSNTNLPKEDIILNKSLMFYYQYEMFDCLYGISNRNNDHETSIKLGSLAKNSIKKALEFIKHKFSDEYNLKKVNENKRNFEMSNLTSELLILEPKAKTYRDAYDFINAIDYYSKMQKVHEKVIDFIKVNNIDEIYLRIHEGNLSGTQFSIFQLKAFNLLYDDKLDHDSLSIKRSILSLFLKSYEQAKQTTEINPEWKLYINTLTQIEDQIEFYLEDNKSFWDEFYAEFIEYKIIEILMKKIDPEIFESLSNNASLSDTDIDIEEMIKKIKEYEKPILYVEDKLDKIYKLIYLKLNKIDFTKDNIDCVFRNNASFTIRRSEGASKLSGILRMPNTDGFDNHKIIGLFDFDTEGRRQFHFLSKDKFWPDDILGDIKTGFYKERKDHSCFVALLIPIPDRLMHLASLEWDEFISYIEIENLLPLEFLKNNNFVKEKKIPGNIYYKMDEKKKSIIWKKLIDEDVELFKDFIPLFEKINEFINE